LEYSWAWKLHRIEKQIKITINQANKKLENCVSEDVLVVSIDPVLDLEEIEILQSFKKVVKKAKSNIKHFYAYGRISAQIMQFGNNIGSYICYY